MSATAPADSTATIESGQNLPQKWGVILFPGFDQLDVAGPMEYLNALALQYPTTLSIVAKSLDPVSTKIPKSFVPGDLPGIEQRWVPTHTFEDAPPLDVLLIPGGYGTFIEDIQQEVGDFIKKTYPSLKYVLTVCTGSDLLARSGLMDGRKATTNKSVFTQLAQATPKVNWVARARWVEDGNIWTSSGVTAGMDMMHHFVSTIYGEKTATTTANTIEYSPNTDPRLDPFAEIWDVKQPTKET